MNDIMQVNNISKTMSSREMAALCKKRHDNTLLIIRDLENRGLLENSRPQYYTHAQNGQQYIEYISDKRDSLVIVARLSPEFMAAVIDRWQELERKELQASQPVIAMPDFTNPAEAARAFADQYEAKQIAQEQLALAQPKVNFYNTVAASNSLMTVSDVAKKMNMSAQALNVRLIEIGAYDKRRLPKKVFSHGFISKSYGAMKLTADGHDRNLLTQAGQMYVIGLFSCNKELEPM